MRKQQKDREYHEIVKDILKNRTFLELENYYHHNSSILEHVKSVSFLSYRICKRLHLDYVSAARGGLLHDFFLYDWRQYKKDKSNKNHGLQHPKVALKNSSRFFQLNEVEKDIILKHMWPKLLGYPKCPESAVVIFADKFCAGREYLSRLFLNHRKTGSGHLSLDTHRKRN